NCFNPVDIKTDLSHFVFRLHSVILGILPRSGSRCSSSHCFAVLPSGPSSRWQKNWHLQSWPYWRVCSLPQWLQVLFMYRELSESTWVQIQNCFNPVDIKTDLS